MMIRVAVAADGPALEALIARSARALSAGFYTPEQIESAVRYCYRADPALIADKTYFVVMDGAAIAGAGGWSRRRSLYHGDVPPPGLSEFLDPATDAARIRAFFVEAGYARRGIGRMLLEHCADEARAAGFGSLELMATLPGVPLYAACGFRELEKVRDVMPDGVAIDFVRMRREGLP
jgi:GNAT superfamily N-acetyltransferase